MTKEEAIKRIEEIKAAAWGYHIGGEVLGIPYSEFVEIMDTVLSALTPPNEPLTSDELRQMDGEPVYIVFSPDVDGEKLQFWALVAVDNWGEVYLMNNLGGSSAYEEAWANIEAIYRRPPEGKNA